VELRWHALLSDCWVGIFQYVWIPMQWNAHRNCGLASGCYSHHSTLLLLRKDSQTPKPLFTADLILFVLVIRKFARKKKVWLLRDKWNAAMQL
jgi:hypothetical protein